VLADQDTLETDAMLNHQLLAEMKIVTPTDDVTMKTDVFVMLDLWEMIVHSRDVKVVVDSINTATTVLVHATLVTLVQFVTSEHAPMIVSDMDIVSMDHAIVALDGLVMIVH